jgi:hypothetical protein
MVPVGRVEKQTLMQSRPCRLRISAFRRHKKASAEPVACPIGTSVPFQSPPIRQPKRVGGHVWGTKAKPLALLLAADGASVQSFRLQKNAAHKAEEERRERHDSLFRVLSHNDIQHWADRFLAVLERKPSASNQLEQMPSVGS